MRDGADSTDFNSLPPGKGVYGAYDDGNWQTYQKTFAAYSTDSLVLALTVNPIDEFGDVLDVETGDAQPFDAPHWVAMRRRAGHPNPGVYCSESVWTAVQQQFDKAGVAQPWYWIAGYPGSVGAGNLYPGALAHQFIDHGSWDESVFVDFIPGLDKPTAAGADVPTSTDVVDQWTVPGSNGAAYFNLMGDGGLDAYGSAVPSQLEYVACANDGARFHFGPSVTPGIISYPGLPAADREGTRYFVAMAVLAYAGAPVGEGPQGKEGPAGPAGPAGPQGAPGANGQVATINGNYHIGPAT